MLHQVIDMNPSSFFAISIPNHLTIGTVESHQTITKYLQMNRQYVLRWNDIATSFSHYNDVKPGLYFSRWLSSAVAHSVVARAGDHSCHRQLSFKCARARPTERQNDPSTEFKFKCKFEFEFKFLCWLVFTPRNNIICAFWMATHIVSMLSG